MAPLVIRQNQSLIPSPPSPAKGPPSPPADISARIDPAVFGELFAGTIGIFVLAVLVWKTGRFIRSFNRHKVLREGKSPNTRFAKTWYGWVRLETHERNKQIFRNIWSFIKKWTRWKTTRADYQWAWWDPDQQALQARRRNRQPLRWLPKYLMSYECPTAGDIWDPKPPVEVHGALISGPIPNIPMPESSHEKAMRCSANTFHCDFLTLSGDTSEETLGSAIWADARLNISSSTISREGAPFHVALNYISRQSLGTFGCRTNIGEVHRIRSFDGQYSSRARSRSSFAAGSAMHSGNERSILPPAIHHRRTRKYRAWAAQMQVKASEPFLYDLRDSSGPPGTPITDIMASLISESADRASMRRAKKNALQGRRSAYPSGQPLDDRSIMLNTAADLVQYGSTRSGSRLDAILSPVSRNNQIQKCATHPWSSVRDSKSAFSRKSTEICSLRENLPAEFQRNIFPTRPTTEKEQKPLPELSDWEIRLMDRLNRKLVWVFHETTPGQKPYHFALLANHWLNRETWLVYDPVSRVSTDARRMQGDPRYNVPYPMPDLSRRPKYPTPERTKAHTPRIDSWRAAVNRYRKISGIQDLVPHVDLYEDSAEEPPDGHIDPACWMLPKPPQGFEISSQQKGAWYEGGAGWQEKLDDWQRVRRGYRLHKAIHEGRAHRNRLKEIASNVNGYCRRVSGNLNRKGAEALSRSD
ncbi:hypothetical protein N7468_006889 [Penicillium chermesinum]|uniref:Uncharacterized protein n=1 Tax=Penicillium chermesinum TaxID=63820 RepID=A0A9W9TK92_9EURO|nr:uncharacterized protein N7468_006889 [Penicillium chermesinum]KAJ5225664.1 hypothetical protein N7468_006889 [Penicillium chermesinum]KAJ6161117.1 hypothetical protein N7470_004513 [Penicillium chermesinum]